MNPIRRLLRRFRRRDLEAEMAEEMRFHLEQRAAELADHGVPAGEARLAAQRRFGNLASLQEQARDTFGWGALERFAKDLQFAARQLVRAPGFSLLAILALGLGIGANTSMFSVLNGISLKPLPYADLERLERIYRSTPQNREGNVAPADFLALADQAADYGEFAGYTPARVSLSDPGQPAQLALGGQVSANLFALLGVTPELGRDFRREENEPGRHRVVILSRRTWLNRYGGKADIVGRTIRIDGEPHEVVGVLPASFNDWRHLGNVDFFRPFAYSPAFRTERGNTHVRIFGKRTADLGVTESQGFIAGFGAAVAREFPEANAGVTWRRVSLQESAMGASGGMILPMLVGLSGFVLLIACSNLANLLLTRTMARAREFAVRAALGASRLQLLRPLLAEALLLSGAGGGVAIMIAHWFRDWAAVRSTGDNGEQVIFVVDWHVMAWAFAASLVTAVAFSLAPALFALRLDLNATLKSGGRGATGTRLQRRFGQFLIIGQFALAMVLLAGAALFIRGLDDLHDRRAGWESAQLVTGTVVLPLGTYADAEKISAFQRLVLERFSALPGVASVALSTGTPFFHWNDVRKFAIDGQPAPAPGREPAALVNWISPDYLATFGMRVVAGRTFDQRDHAEAPRVYLVSRSTARAFFGDADPIGRRLAPLGTERDASGQIIGVVADFQNVDPDPNAVPHQVYVPLAQEPQRQFELAVRAAGVAPGALVDAIRATMTELDADLPIRSLQPADETIRRTLYQLRVLRDMLGAFGLLGLGLASLGVYGVIARTMAQRSGEFAIRLALGARVADITRLVLATGARQALAGSALGLIGAVGVSAIIAASYPGIRTDNAVVLAGTAVFLVAIALLACWLPARRAGRVDAMRALRAE